MSKYQYDQFCALARAAERLGERWSLLIVRELLLGPRRFVDLQAGLDGVSSSVLAQRLLDMERDGLVRRTELAPPASGSAYELTEHGLALRPAVLELIRWGSRFLLPRRSGERFDPQWLLLALPACALARNSPPHAVQLLLPAKGRDVPILVSGGRSGTTVEGRLAPADATIRGEAMPIFELATGMADPARALADSRLQISGSRAVARLLPKFFATGLPQS
jgi:DNA-binding HxlR family transcriptional regulator